MGPHHPCPRDGLCPCFSKDRAAGPPRGPLTTLSHSQGPQRRGEFPLRDSFVPPRMCSFSHCDFALLPTHSGVGEELPRKHSLGQVLAFLTFRDSCRKEGNGVFSPTALSLPPPPRPQAPCLAPAPRASPAELWVRWAIPPPPHGKMSQASHGRPSSAQSQVDWNCAKPQNLPHLQDSVCGGRSTSICDRLVATKQSGSRPTRVSGRVPGGEKSLVVSLV